MIIIIIIIRRATFQTKGPCIVRPLKHRPTNMTVNLRAPHKIKVTFQCTFRQVPQKMYSNFPESISYRAMHKMVAGASSLLSFMPHVC